VERRALARYWLGRRERLRKAEGGSGPLPREQTQSAFGVASRERPCVARAASQGHRLEQGAVLQEQGERVDQVYFPHDGIISPLAVMRQGDAIETATIGYEGAVGSLARFGPRRAHTRAVVQVRGSASRIAASRFRRVAEDSEAVCRIVVRYGEMLC
jgi:CRP-like cAMP-binding protein